MAEELAEAQTAGSEAAAERDSLAGQLGDLRAEHTELTAAHAALRCEPQRNRARRRIAGNLGAPCLPRLRLQPLGQGCRRMVNNATC